MRSRAVGLLATMAVGFVMRFTVTYHAAVCGGFVALSLILCSWLLRSGLARRPRLGSGRWCPWCFGRWLGCPAVLLFGPFWCPGVASGRGRLHGMGSGAHGGFAAGSRHALFREGGRGLWHLVPVRFACGIVRSRGVSGPWMRLRLFGMPGPLLPASRPPRMPRDRGEVTARAQAPSPWMVSHLPGVCCPAPARAQAFACVWWCGCSLPWR